MVIFGLRFVHSIWGVVEVWMSRARSKFESSGMIGKGSGGVWVRTGEGNWVGDGNSSLRYGVGGSGGVGECRSWVWVSW